MAKKSTEQVPHAEKYLQEGAPYATNAKPLNCETDRDIQVPQRDHAYGEFMYFATPRNGGGE